MLERLIAPLVGLVFVFVLFVGAIQPREASVPVPHGEHPVVSKWTWDGPLGFGVLGKFDNQQLQRGFQVYREACSGCHGITLLSFRNLQQIGFSEGEVKAIAKEYQVASLDQDTGEPATRPGIASDKFPPAFANDIAARAANNNAVPPDLTLMAKAREGGPDYIHSLMIGYDERGRPKGWETPEGLYFNRYFTNLNIAMPPPLSVDGQVTYADGTSATVDQMARDVSAFLMWAAEPTMVERKQTGLGVIIFLTILGIFSYLTYRSVWAPLKAQYKEPHPAE